MNFNVVSRTTGLYFQYERIVQVTINIEHKIKLKVKCKASDLIPAAILAISKAELAPLTLSWARPGE